MRVYFDKLLNREYSTDVEMELINWFLKTGNKFDEYVGRWTKDGVSKQIFNYSANSHNANFPFPIVCKNHIGNGSMSFNVIDSFIQLCLYNAIIKKPSKPVKKWRESENIKTGKYRVLDINTDTPSQKNEKFKCTHWALQKLQDFIGIDLKKENFHPDYKERLNPKVVNIILYTNGGGYVFEYVFSFSNFEYEPGWSKYIIQQKDESVSCFVNRIFNEIDLVRHVS